MIVKPVHYKCMHVQEAQELLNDLGTVIIGIKEPINHFVMRH